MAAKVLPIRGPAEALPQKPKRTKEEELERLLFEVQRFGNMARLSVDGMAAMVESYIKESRRRPCKVRKPLAKTAERPSENGA